MPWKRAVSSSSRGCTSCKKCARARRGKEVLMFVRDPSGNVIELFCKEGFKDADKLPHGWSRRHRATVDLDRIRYTDWKRPNKQGSRIPTGASHQPRQA